MYRLDKIDAQLVHIVPAVDRYGAAAAADAGAKCRVRRQVILFRLNRDSLHAYSSSREALSVQAEAHSGALFASLSPPT